MEMTSTRREDEAQEGRGLGLLTEDLRRVLRTELLRDTCSAAKIAALFSMHRRTLHRHLHTEGLAFRQIADEIRFEIACEMLENTDMTLGQVAAALNYSEPSAFTRAFRRWSGQTPSTWRSSHRHIRKFRLPRKAAAIVSERAQQRQPTGTISQSDDPKTAEVKPWNRKNQ